MPIQVLVQGSHMFDVFDLLCVAKRGQDNPSLQARDSRVPAIDKEGHFGVFDQIAVLACAAIGGEENVTVGDGRCDGHQAGVGLAIMLRRQDGERYGLERIFDQLPHIDLTHHVRDNLTARSTVSTAGQPG